MDSTPTKIHTFPKNNAFEEELLAIKLLYCIKSRPQAQQKKVMQNIQGTLKTAIYRAIDTVEKILNSNGYFEGSNTLLDDYYTLIDLIIDRTDLGIVQNFLQKFYEKGIDSLEKNELITFYNCLSSNLQKEKIRKQKIGVRFIDLQSNEQNVEERRMGNFKDEQLKSQKSTEKKSNQLHSQKAKIFPTKLTEQMPIVNESISSLNQQMASKTESIYKNQINQHQLQNDEERPMQNNYQDPNNQKSDVEIVQKLSLANGLISESSRIFIEEFTQGVESTAGLKGKKLIVKKYKIPCLQSGQQSQRWEYFDSLAGGIVKVVFTGVKNE